MLEKNIKVLKEARVKLEESIKDAEKVVKETKTQKRETNKRLSAAVKANKPSITQTGLAIQKISIDNDLKRNKLILEVMNKKLDQLNKTITDMENMIKNLGEEWLGGHGERRGRRGRRRQ